MGGGIIGLAVARELIRRRADTDVCVLERENELGAHQTGHNSGVVHAGLYYAPGSLKALLCVEGSRRMYEYCDEKGIPYVKCGKVVVATGPAEIPGLDEIERRARANGVEGVRRLDTEGIREVEPHVTGIAAIRSPATGIVDFGLVARSIADDFTAEGGTIAVGSEVRELAPAGRELRIRHARGVLEARRAICCAGAWSDRLAVASGADRDPRILPFRGAYLKLSAERRSLVRSLVYPVPDPSLPFLGVHLTRHIDGEVLVGPTALLVGARDAYAAGRVRPADLGATLAWPGSWRMFRRWWRTGIAELRHAASRRAFVEAASRYVPELSAADVEPAFAGIRAQAVARDGSLVDDFVFSRTERALHVRNAPSPAATSSLAIAGRIADEAEASIPLA